MPPPAPPTPLGRREMSLLAPIIKAKRDFLPFKKEKREREETANNFPEQAIFLARQKQKTMGISHTHNHMETSLDKPVLVSWEWF